jgi:flagellar FliJ protein
VKRFQFPLRPVAVVRAHRELRAREALAAAIQVCVRADERLAQARARVAELENAISADRLKNWRAAAAAAAQQAYRRECGGEAEALKQVSQARAAMEKRREVYLEANRQVKAVAKLEEHARSAHYLEMLRAEQGELDEIAVTRAARRKETR